MPPIHISHRGARNHKGLGASELSALGYVLAEEGARRFSLPERPMTTGSFDCYPEALQEGGRQKCDVVIRFDLHNDDIRVDNAQENAEALETLASDFLNTEMTVARRGRLSVRVYLVLAYVAYAESEPDEHAQPTG